MTTIACKDGVIAADTACHSDGLLIGAPGDRPPRSPEERAIEAALAARNAKADAARAAKREREKVRK
jgi:hypothetical protein